MILAAAELHIGESDVFGTGRLPLTSFGSVYMPARLSMTQVDSQRKAAE